MPKRSAGLLMYRFRESQIEVFLVHPGGPFWQKKDLGAWSVPKGEYGDGEDALTVAKREFTEETGIPISDVEDFLGEIKQPSGKHVSVWTLEGDCSVSQITSNTFSMEWPPKTGKIQEFPEVDAAEWFPVEVAVTKVLKGQKGFIDLLTKKVNYTYSSPETLDGD